MSYIYLQLEFIDFNGYWMRPFELETLCYCNWISLILMPLLFLIGQNKRKWFWLTCTLNLGNHGNTAQERPYEIFQKFWKKNLTWYVGLFISKMWNAFIVPLPIFLIVQVVNAGFEVEFYLLKRILRYVKLSSIPLYVKIPMSLCSHCWWSLQGRERRMGAIWLNPLLLYISIWCCIPYFSWSSCCSPILECSSGTGKEENLLCRYLHEIIFHTYLLHLH